MPEKIISVKASEQFFKDYKEYALYVERHRTTPEFRDGLKPVQRRIIYAAYFVSHAVDEKRKSSKVVGDTMGHYHPHGDSSIQGALYTMVNWYQTKMPLFTGQGNFGNTYENVPAAPRYTEVKLSKFAVDCILGELMECKEIVDWTQTYDNSRLEPEFLPTKLPLLLINGCSAIAVGDKVDIPSHNINEVIDATIQLIKHPKSNIALIPDHCQACEIVDTDWMDISKKGYGHYKIRGVVDIEPYSGVNKKYKDCMTLVIKSCPNLTFLTTIIEKIEDMVTNNKIIGIIDVEEQSSENNMRYVLVLKPGTDPNYIKNELYKNTLLMQTGRVNFKVFDYDDKEHPTKRLSYKGYLTAWIEFRKLTKLRYYENKLQKLMTRLHMIQLYTWAIESGKADTIINIVKSNKNNDEAIVEELVKKCKITDIQAKFFINCEIKKLSKGYLKRYKEEQDKLTKETNYCRDMILKDGAIEQVIINELEDIKKKYGEPRKCKIIKESEVTGIPEGEFKIVLTEGNFIKKIGVNDSITKPKNDTIKFVINGDNSKSLLLFDSVGKVFDLPISKIPFSDKYSNGIDIRLINKYINARITSVVYGPIMEQFINGCIVTLTNRGYVKRMTTSDFLSVPQSGLVYCKLDDGDSIIDLLLFANNAEVIIYGEKKALRINIDDIPMFKRNARGCISMSSKSEVQLEGISVISKDSTDVVVVTKNGYINRIIPDSISKGRTKAGSNVIKLGKTDRIVSMYGVNNNSSITCILSTSEQINIPVKDIPIGTSVSTGVKMLKGEVVAVYKSAAN